MLPILRRAGDTEQRQGVRQAACLRVTRPTALSSLILNHETTVHDTLPCSAQIRIFTVSTEI